MAKSIGLNFYWFEYILDVKEISKPQKRHWPYTCTMYTLKEATLLVLAWQQIRKPFHCLAVSGYSRHHDAVKKKELFVILTN